MESFDSSAPKQHSHAREAPQKKGFFCPSCSAPVAEGLKFCTECGKPTKPSCRKCGKDVGKGEELCSSCKPKHCIRCKVQVDIPSSDTCSKCTLSESTPRKSAPTKNDSTASFLEEIDNEKASAEEARLNRIMGGGSQPNIKRPKTGFTAKSAAVQAVDKGGAQQAQSGNVARDSPASIHREKEDDTLSNFLGDLDNLASKCEQLGEGRIDSKPTRNDEQQRSLPSSEPQKTRNSLDDALADLDDLTVNSFRSSDGQNSRTPAARGTSVSLDDALADLDDLESVSQAPATYSKHAPPSNSYSSQTDSLDSALADLDDLASAPQPTYSSRTQNNNKPQVSDSRGAAQKGSHLDLDDALADLDAIASTATSGKSNAPGVRQRSTGADNLDDALTDLETLAEQPSSRSVSQPSSYKAASAKVDSLDSALADLDDLASNPHSTRGDKGRPSGSSLDSALADLDDFASNGNSNKQPSISNTTGDRNSSHEQSGSISAGRGQGPVANIIKEVEDDVGNALLSKVYTFVDFFLFLFRKFFTDVAHHSFFLSLSVLTSNRIP